MAQNRTAMFFAATSAGTTTYLSKSDEEYIKKDPVMWAWPPRFMNRNDVFYHPNVLFSAAHHFKKYPDLRKQLYLDDDVVIFIDSGGFQLATGALNESNWNNEKALAYSEKNGDIFPILDRPATAAQTSSELEENLKLTELAARYYMENRSRDDCAILNVLSSKSPEDFDFWYRGVEQFDFDGWAHGGHRGNLKTVLLGFLYLLNKGEYDKPNVKYHHVFGVSGMIPQVFFSCLQHIFNKKGIDVQITYDSSYHQIQAAYGKFFSFPSFRGQRSIPVSNKVDYSHIDENIPMPCSCPVCATVPSLKEFLTDSEALYMKTVCHNLYQMDALKRFADSIFAAECKELEDGVFDSKMRRNISLLRKAFDNPKTGSEYINRMDIGDTKDTVPVNLTTFFA